MKTLIEQQQKTLEQQQAEILALQSALAEQKKLLVGLVQGETSGATVVPAAEGKIVDDIQAQGEPLRTADEQQSLTTAQEQVQEECSAARKLLT